MFSRLCLSFRFAGVAVLRGGRRAACEPLKPRNRLRLSCSTLSCMLTCFSTSTCFTCCSPRLPFHFLSLDVYFSPLAAVGGVLEEKKKKRTGADGEKRAIVGKCSFLSGMTQAAAVISTVIVGHHQRASITPARSWHRQQVPALPASLAPTRL